MTLPQHQLTSWNSQSAPVHFYEPQQHQLTSWGSKDLTVADFLDLVSLEIDNKSFSNFMKPTSYYEDYLSSFEFEEQCDIFDMEDMKVCEALISLKRKESFEPQPSSKRRKFSIHRISLKRKEPEEFYEIQPSSKRRNSYEY